MALLEAEKNGYKHFKYCISNTICKESYWDLGIIKNDLEERFI